MATINNFFSYFKTKTAFTLKLEASEINENGITFIGDTNEIYTHKTYYSCSVDQEALSQAIRDAIAETIVQVTGESTDKVMSQKAVSDEITKLAKSITDLALINEPVYNVSELLPTSGLEGGNKYDLTTALTQLDSLLDPEEKKVGIKVKFINSKDKCEIYNYEGSTFTSEDSWSLSLTDNDFDKIIAAIPLASSDVNGLMSSSDKTKLDSIESTIDSKVNELKETVDNYTVNGHKISENPVLNKTDVGLANVDNTSDLNKPVSTATQEAINAAKQEVSQSITDHTSNQENPHNVTKDQVGLSNVTNDAQVKRSEMGVANGVATLDEDGKVPVSQLSGSMARVFGIEKAIENQAALPEDATEGDRYYTIDTKKIYERLTDSWDEGTAPKEDTIYNFRKSDATGSEERTNILYRWDGEELVEISSSIALGETAGTAYEGSKGKANRDAISSLPSDIVSSVTEETSGGTVSITIKKSSKSGLNYSAGEGSTITITKGSIGLDKVNNTSDLDKPVSTATQQAIDAAKEEVSQSITEHISDQENPHNVTKAQVGLANVDNTSDADKPISTATQEALDTITGTITSHTSNHDNPHQVTKAQVGLDKVDNTSDLEKPISTATQQAISGLDSKIDGEIARATGVEGGLQGSIDIINGEGEGSIKKGDRDTLASSKEYSDSLFTWFEGD